jgi:hypothetical protein
MWRTMECHQTSVAQAYHGIGWRQAREVFTADPCQSLICCARVLDMMGERRGIKDRRYKKT